LNDEFGANEGHKRHTMPKYKVRAMLILKDVCRKIFFLSLLVSAPSLYSDAVGTTESDSRSENVSSESILKDSWEKSRHKKHKKFAYHLYIKDFIKSFIEIPTSNVSDPSSTVSSKYLAGRAAVYNTKNKKVGICSASFLCMQNENGIYTDISNYLSVDSGLIVSWLTPTTLINLELDSILHSMVTECIVKASTKIGFNPFYGQDFNMIVSSDDKKIYFKLYEK
jgi:hypothetical protein